MVTRDEAALVLEAGDVQAPTSRPKEKVHVVDHALTVLKYICMSTEPRGIRELGRDLEIGKSTVQRILVSLTDAGLVSFDPQLRKYRPGAGLLTLAWTFSSGNDLVGSTAVIADDLAERTKETVSVSTLVGVNRVTVYEAPSVQALKLTTGVGRPHSILQGATSRVLLSLLQPEQRSRVIASALERPDKPFDRAAMEELVARVDAEGQAVSHGEWIPGAVGVSVPIGRQGDQVGALSIYGPSVRMTEEVLPGLLEQLHEAAERARMAWGAY